MNGLNNSLRGKFLLLISLLLAVTAVKASPYRCEDNALMPSAAACDIHGGLWQAAVCGNGLIEAGEGCDNASGNSDTKPDACRTWCARATCGDNVVDSNEQCEEHDLNHYICSDLKQQGNDHYPGPVPNFWGGTLSCDIDDCTFDVSECHYCGDGMTQMPHEQCDDGNSSNDDGCNNNCTACVNLGNNIDITNDTEICTKNFDVDDYGDLGVIVIKAPNLTLDCDGASLTGQGDGIGIYIKRSDNVTVKNCIIDNYRYGIYVEDSNNVQILGMKNRISNTEEKVVLDESTALPPPPIRMNKADTGLSPQQQALMGQQLHVKRVPSLMGDRMKLDAIAGKNITTTTSGSASPGQSPAGPNSTSAAPQRAEQSKTITPVRPAIALPIVTFPRKGERFSAPARISAKARYDSNKSVLFTLKRLPDKRVLQRSEQGQFRDIMVGNYCIEAAYKGSRKGGDCVEFSVVNRPTPVKPTLRPITR